MHVEIDTIRLFVEHGMAAQKAVDELISHRCVHCGMLMPPDVGTWIVAIDGGAVVVLCSRECEAQLPRAPDASPSLTPE